MVFPGGTSGRELKYLPVFYELKVPASAGDTRDVASIPGSGKSPEGGHGNPLQCSFLENCMDWGAWWAPIHRVTKSQTWLKWLSMQCNQSFSSIAQLCPTLCDPWTAARQASLSTTNFRSLLKLTSIKSVMPSNLLIRSLLLPPSIFASIRVFSNESVLCIRWTNYSSFSFSISPSNEYSELISFRIDWSIYYIDCNVID